MDTSFTKQETYIQEFNSKDYLETYYSAEKGVLKGEWLDFALRKFHETFTPGGVEGDTLIDIGAGPTIYHLLSACEVFKNIISSDLVAQNRDQMQKWLKKDPDAFDWSPVAKYVCELEGDSENWKKREDKLRRAVKQVLKCDVLKSNPFEPEVLPPADCVLCCLCLESACNDAESYRNTLKHFYDLIKPGGHLIILSVLNSSFYYVGQKCFYAKTTKKEDLELDFKGAGYEIEKLEVLSREDLSALKMCDYDGYYFVHARKPHNL
ncbi:nicotinamide N-methyltransferase-like isoform X2 [Ascaphus truei]|uniref:nicotinamide N-methyltransferase-like isoform X2 n=1 Tax=Ascaphus truei TaxID=8439 RepID=UPI003F598863